MPDANLILDFGGKKNGINSQKEVGGKKCKTDMEREPFYPFSEDLNGEDFQVEHVGDRLDRMRIHEWAKKTGYISKSEYSYEPISKCQECKGLLILKRLNVREYCSCGCSDLLCTDCPHCGKCTFVDEKDLDINHKATGKMIVMKKPAPSHRSTCSPRCYWRKTIVPL